MHLIIALIVHLIQCKVIGDISKSGLLFNPHGPTQKHGNMQQLPQLWFNPSLSDMLTRKANEKYRIQSQFASQQLIFTHVS